MQMAAVYVATAARTAACVTANSQAPEAWLAAADANGNNTCSCMVRLCWGKQSAEP